MEMDEENRPEFETNATTFRMNPVTREKEPYMSTWSRAIRFVITGSAVLFMVISIGWIRILLIVQLIIYRSLWCCLPCSERLSIAYRWSRSSMAAAASL